MRDFFIFHLHFNSVSLCWAVVATSHLLLFPIELVERERERDSDDDGVLQDRRRKERKISCAVAGSGYISSELPVNDNPWSNANDLAFHSASAVYTFLFNLFHIYYI